MQDKVQNDWDVIAAELTKRLQQSELSARELSYSAGIDYYAARRFKMQGVKNKTEAAARLCTFFRISNETANARPFESSAAAKAIDRVWDGTQAQEELLAAIILSIGDFRIAKKAGGD